MLRDKTYMMQYRSILEIVTAGIQLPVTLFTQLKNCNKMDFRTKIFSKVRKSKLDALVLRLRLRLRLLVAILTLLVCTSVRCHHIRGGNKVRYNFTPHSVKRIYETKD